MARACREFTPECKSAAVKLVINTGRRVSTVAQQLGINEASLGRWVNAFTGRRATAQTTVTESERAELLWLAKRTRL